MTAVCPAVRSEEELLPEQLDALWRRVENAELSHEEFDETYTRLLARYRDMWEQALLLDGHTSLKESLLAEVGMYLGLESLIEAERRCREAAKAVQSQWRERVVDGSRASIEAFYDESMSYIYDLMWWHNLQDDDDPLAYVLALRFANRQGWHRCLDFGAGVGSGSILFARHGMEITNADISSALLAFNRWRFELRHLPVAVIDTKVSGLPPESFQMVTAMDTLEHLADPVETVERLWECLEPGGVLYGRFNTKPNDNRPQHIVRDFGPTLERMKALGFVEVWRDEWLWGHQAFQKC
jgi:2-polyprenyl-3-methyl-5-hydroxy-6-metoxy-1,4-benzoquinol methylase